MTEDGNPNQNSLAVNKEPDFVPQADSISIETLVNVLVRKGICTTNEIFMLEGQIREKQMVIQAAEYQRIKEQTHSHNHKSKNRWLKRMFAKARWTRKLGEKLFGWRWKKVKQSNGTFHHNHDD